MIVSYKFYVLCSLVSIICSLDSQRPLNQQVNQRINNQNKNFIQGEQNIMTNIKIPQNQSQNQFRFVDSFKIPQSYAAIKNIDIINNQTIAIQGYLNSHQQVNIFSGEGFQTKISQYNISSGGSAKLFNGKLYMKDGEIIYENRQNAQINHEFSSKYGFNSKPLTTDKYILIQNRSICPSFIKIDKQTMKMQTIFPDGEKNCTCEWCEYTDGFLEDLGNGKIAFAISFNLYILNNQTLEIEQTLVEIDQLHDTDFSYIDSWYVQQTKQSVILLKGKGFNYQTFTFNKSTNQYEQSNRFYGTSNNMRLTALNQGYSFYKNVLLHWNKLQYQNSFVDDNVSNQQLRGKTFLVMSKNQDFFLMKNKYSFEVYVLNQQSPSFEITFKQSINVGYYTDKSYLTSDDRYLFLIDSLNDKKLAIYDFTQKTFVHLQQQIYEDFAIFQSSYDRFVLLRSEKIIVDNISKISYFIQIRKTSDSLTVLKQIPLILPEGSQIFSIRLDKNDDWGLKFLVLYKTLNITDYSDDSLQQICSIQSDNLMQGETMNKKISFYNTYATSKWIVTIPYLAKFVNVFKVDTLTSVKKIPLIGSYPRNIINPIFAGNKLILQNSLTRTQLLQIDFGKQNPQEFQISRMYKQYYRGFISIQLKDYSILFQKKGLLYMFNPWTISDQDPVKVVYNISSFPVDNWMTYNQSQGENLIYILKNENRQCDLIVDTWDNLLRVWKNCQPYDQITTYQLLNRSRSAPIQVYQCSDNKHIVVKYSLITYQDRIEIRSIDENFKVIWQNYQAMGARLEADFTKDKKIILNYYNFVKIINFQMMYTAINFGMKNIMDFDVAIDGRVAITGEGEHSTYSKRIYEFVIVDSNKKQLFQLSYQSPFFLSDSKIRFHPNGNLLLLCYSSKSEGFFKFQVWNLQTEKTIFEVEIGGSVLKSMQFLNETTIFGQIDNAYSIMSFNIKDDNIQENKILKSLQLPSSDMTAISKNGSLIAFMTLGVYGYVDIYDGNLNQISHIKVSTQYFPGVTMAFSDNNTLYIAGYDSTIYVFAPGDCPNTFINNNSYCICRKYSFESGGTCKCLQNFIQQQNGNCQCEGPFIQNEDVCKCPQNTTQIDNSCGCNKNFINQDNLCICPSGFKFQQRLCFCQTGTYEQENVCNECSFFCSSCHGAGFQCSSYSSGFYWIVITGSSVILAVISVVMFKILVKRKKMPVFNSVNKNRQKLSENLLTEQQQQNSSKGQL